ncbi:MAG TPA: hypothetical protein VMS74_00130 [Acidimicrobiia bacterium]|nr:hypothetical protein [Acidimicrobiia bacterium]
MAICLLVVACGGGTVPSAGLPRTTDQNIRITMVESVETLPLPGCHTYWMTRNQEPPAGACEQTADVRRFIAQLDTETVETSVVGNPTFDPLYAMQLASRNLTEGVSVVVVVPPPNATLVRLIDSTGEVVDRVTTTGGIVALAGLGPDLNVQAIAEDGGAIAECPPDGATLGGITYACSIAPGATIPITTTTLSDGHTP